MSPPVARQVIASMKSIMNGDGLHRVKQLARNSRYFRKKLQQMGFLGKKNECQKILNLGTYFLNLFFSIWS